MLKKLESMKGMLRGIKSQLETQGNTNQQLTMTVVNFTGPISFLRAQPAQMPPVVPMTQPTMQTEVPLRRVDEGIKECNRRHDHKENRRSRLRKETGNHYKRRDRNPLYRK
ncbi:hypothetical protein DPMN_155161 [Dreissena polymorpha]|uniref:Uncharacterized protein n=2 Tax=Dreissena polymorpha TaxID=45954 RepID=A0A9D4FQP3_DREPO|nr:hypothetical protein DPMN_155161 [Dreissena polymorpha]